MKVDDENPIPDENPDEGNGNHSENDYTDGINKDCSKDDTPHKENKNNFKNEQKEDENTEKETGTTDGGKTTSSANIESKEIKDSYIAGRDIRIDKSDKPNGLPKKINDLGAIKYDILHEADQVKDLLIKNQLMVLNCASNEVARSIVHFIANLDEFESYNKYQCYFDRYEKSSQLVNLLEDCKKHVFQEDENQLLFIYDSQNNETPKLLESLSKENDLGKNDILSELNNTTYIIYCSYHQNIDYLKSSHFDFHFIDAFYIYVGYRSFAKKVINDLKEQQKKGLWGSGKELLIDLDKHNESQIIEIIETKKEGKKTDFISILSDGSRPVARYALFVATFFPKSNPGVFREYVEILLQKKEIIVDENKVSLLEIWNEGVDDILYDCRLETYRKNKQYLIDFSTSTEASQCEEILYGRFTSFIDQQARILIKKQQLFTDNTSKIVHFKIYPIIAKLAISFKDYYGDELLKEWLSELEMQRKKLDELNENFDKLKSYKKSNDFDAVEYRDISIRIEIAADKKNKFHQKLNKNVYLFVHLLNTIHEKDTHKEIVLDFFSDSFQTIYSNHIIMDILGWFQINNPQHNLFEHYKYAFEHSDKKVNKHAFRAFSYFLLIQPSNFYASVKRIKKWFPATTTSYKDYTQLQKYMVLVWHNCLTSLMEWDDKHIKIEAYDKSDTFLTLFNDHEQFTFYMDFIICNLFVPNTKEALHELFYTSFIDKEFIENIVEEERALLIEYWLQLLKHQQIINNADSEGNKNLQVLMDGLQKQLDKPQKRSLIKRLGKIRNTYNQHILKTNRYIGLLNESSDNYNENKEKIKTKRNYLADFIKLLKNNHGKRT